MSFGTTSSGKDGKDIPVRGGLMSFGSFGASSSKDGEDMASAAQESQPRSTNDTNIYKDIQRYTNVSNVNHIQPHMASANPASACICYTLLYVRYPA
jgi:hypothetical protein